MLKLDFKPKTVWLPSLCSESLCWDAADAVIYSSPHWSSKPGGLVEITLLTTTQVSEKRTSKSPAVDQHLRAPAPEYLLAGESMSHSSIFLWFCLPWLLPTGLFSSLNRHLETIKNRAGEGSRARNLPLWLTAWCCLSRLLPWPCFVCSAPCWFLQESWLPK